MLEEKVFQMVEVKLYLTYTRRHFIYFPWETAWRVCVCLCMFVCVYWRESHLCRVVWWILCIWLFSDVPSIFPKISFVFYHIYNICIPKITHFPSSDFMAFSNYNLTFQVLYQSLVLHSLAGVLAFKMLQSL